MLSSRKSCLLFFSIETLQKVGVKYSKFGVNEISWLTGNNSSNIYHYDSVKSRKSSVDSDDFGIITPVITELSNVFTGLLRMQFQMTGADFFFVSRLSFS